MKKLITFFFIFFISFVGFSQRFDIIKYKDWKLVYNNNCETKKKECIDFYYAITRSRTKIYNAQDNRYYYYYYLLVQSNSTYHNGTWAYTKLNGVRFYINGVLIHYEPYVLFRENKMICIFYHEVDANAKISFNWEKITIY